MTSVEAPTLSEQQIYSAGIGCWTTLYTKKLSCFPGVIINPERHNKLPSFSVRV